MNDPDPELPAGSQAQASEKVEPAGGDPAAAHARREAPEHEPGAPGLELPAVGRGFDAVAQTREFLESRSRRMKIVNGMLALFAIAATVIGLSVDWPAFRELVLGKERAPRARIEVSYALDGDEVFTPIQQLVGELPSRRARLKLSVLCKQEPHLYLLALDGAGRAKLRGLDDLQEGTQRRQGAEGAWLVPWDVEGPPASETLLLIATPEPLDGDELVARVGALHLVPRLPENTHLVWGSRGWEPESTGVAARDVGEWKLSSELGWADRLRDALSAIDGACLSGRTYPVSGSPGR